MSKYFFVVLVALVFGLEIVTAQLGRVCHTPILNARKNLDLQRFSGTWYRIEYAYFNKTAEPSKVKCDTMLYERQPEGSEFQIRATSTYRYVDTGLWETDRGNISTPNSDVPAIWKAEWQLVEGEPLQNVILATDYSNWAYNYGCQMQPDGSSSEILNIWSRTREIDPKVLLVLRNFMNALGFSASANVIVDHTSC